MRRFAASAPSADRVLLSLWLALMWVLLWGSLSPLVLLSAAVVGPACLWAARIPPLPVRVHPRWRRVPMAVWHFAADLVRSSLEVSWAVLRRGPRTRSGVVAIPAVSDSDIALAVAANRISLVPGTLVLEVDRPQDTLYVYVFDVQTDDDVRRARRGATVSAAEVIEVLGAASEAGATPNASDRHREDRS